MTGDPIKKVREYLEYADRHRRLANGAETARVSIRLGKKPQTEHRRTFRLDTKVFTRDETWALYEALAIVRDNNEKLAADFEQRALEGGK